MPLNDLCLFERKKKSLQNPLEADRLKHSTKDGRHTTNLADTLNYSLKRLSLLWRADDVFPVLNFPVPKLGRHIVDFLDKKIFTGFRRCCAHDAGGWRTLAKRFQDESFKKRQQFPDCGKFWFVGTRNNLNMFRKSRQPAS